MPVSGEADPNRMSKSSRTGHIRMATVMSHHFVDSSVSGVRRQFGVVVSGWGYVGFGGGVGVCWACDDAEDGAVRVVDCDVVFGDVEGELVAG